MERQLRTLFHVAAGCLLAAGPASAQSASLADALAVNASCASVTDARASLEFNVALAPPETSQDAIVSALRQLAGRDDLCTELKNAARDFAEQAAPPPVVVAPPAEPVTPASSTIVAATLAEAQRRAENLKFEVAPPPRFMTKERISGP